MKPSHGNINNLLTQPRVCGMLLAFSTLVVFLRIASEAWIGEDAFITYRVIDNFINGHGLRWNIDERVQVYTHPLWMLLNLSAYAITREVFYTVTLLGLACSVSAYFIVARRLMSRPLVLILALLIPFLGSRSLALYGTSGFETSLAFLLLALFTLELLPADPSRPRRWGWLALWVGLAAVNRLDHILLYALPLAYLCISQWRQVNWARLALGMAPLALWLLFSIVYYGFFFPNTARAKLGTNTPLDLYLHEGILYTANLIVWDRASGLILLAVLAAGIGAMLRAFSKSGSQRDGLLAALTAGVFLYGAYILSIGGGFLSGRFWAPPLFLAVLVIALGSEAFLGQLRQARKQVVAGVLIGLVGLGFALYSLPQLLASSTQRSPVLDRSKAHFRLNPDLSWAISKRAAYWQEAGLDLQQEAQATGQPSVMTTRAIGIRGLNAGPQVIIIDILALADPLLSALPLRGEEQWRIGHFPRMMPAGYVRARKDGSLDEMSPPLRDYYVHLRRVVSGPIFDWERVRTIGNFMLHRYDPLIEQWRLAVLSKRSGKLQAAKTELAAPPGNGSTDRPALAASWNVLMIVVDTLRADHLGVYGYPKSTSPKVDEFAAQSFVFDRMYSQAPWTKPSIASLFTSLYPPQHLVLHEGTENQLADSLTTLAEVLKAAGYRTLAASQNPHVRANTGFSQGFDEFHGIPGYKSSIGEMVQKNMQFLNAAGEQPTFIYLHFLDPHGPYDPPPALRKKFIGEQQTDNLSVKRGRVAGLLKGEFPKKSIGPADLQYLEALYDAEIHSVDDSIGRILKQLQDHGVRENTLVIITADHGEEFLDHGTIKHGYQLFEEVIQIPLIFSVPGGIAGRNQSAIVEHVDLMPTVLDFLRIEAPSELQGRSLRSLLEDPATQTDRTAYIGSSWRGIERFAVRQGDWKLIRNEEQDKTTLYHLDGDPNEQHDVSAAHPEMVQKMLEDYRMTTQPISGVTPLSAIGDRDPELERALKSLGYLESDDSE